MKWFKRSGRLKWCEYCWREITRANRTVDHVVPKSRGGTNDKKNILVACKECNQEKGVRDVAFFLYERRMRSNG